MVQCPTCGEQTVVPFDDIFDAAPERAQPSPRSQPEPPEPPPEQSPAFQLQVKESHFEESAVARPAALEAVASDYESDDSTPAHGAEESDEDDAPPAFQLRRKSRTDEDMDLTPMVDVTFQLLIFFMVTASFALQKSIQVPTPDPDQKGATQQLQILEDLEGSSIRVQIDSANVIAVDDEPVTDATRLTEVLKDKMRKEQKTELLISVHAAALHRSVIAVIDAANDVGMQKIRMISRQGKSE